MDVAHHMFQVEDRDIARWHAHRAMRLQEEFDLTGNAQVGEEVEFHSTNALYYIPTEGHA